jgi:ribosome-associated translation inhibitor RaiA
MQIEVLGEEMISAQARTYAEYRVFAALTQFAETSKVRYARVMLHRAKGKHGCESVTCHVTVALDGAPSLRIRTTDEHAYAAINGAIERLRLATSRADLPLARRTS